MDIWSVVVLIAGIILSFSGVIFAMLGANQKKTLERVQSQVDANTQRIGILETHYATMKAELHSMSEDTKDIKRMIEKHLDRS
jgi:uncharacterized membrane-anchored protein YhcB (DUF1043 family)